MFSFGGNIMPPQIVQFFSEPPPRKNRCASLLAGTKMQNVWKISLIYVVKAFEAQLWCCASKAQPSMHSSDILLSRVTRWENVCDQPGHSLTKKSSNQIAKKTIDFEDSTAQEPRKWRKNAKAVAKIAFRVLFFCRKNVNYSAPFLYFSNLW